MNEIINQINRYISSGFKENTLVDQILKKYNALDSDNKKELEPYMYLVYRGKFDSLFLSSNYVKSIFWLNKVINHEKFKIELPDNKDHFLIEAVNSLLIVYLEKENIDLLSRAKKYFKNIKEVPPRINSLKEIYMKNINIFHAIKYNNLFTETSFTVPISIKTIQGKVHIVLPQDEIEADVTCTSLAAQNTMYQSNTNIMRAQDYDATYNISTWTIIMSRYLSCEEPSPLDGSASKMQEIACKIVNKIIDKYRGKTNEYWIKRIYPAMIQGHSIKYRAGEFVFRDIPFYDRGEMILSSKKNEISLTEKNGMITEDPPLYKKLFMDSQTYLLTQNLGSSILLLNMAFENFTYTVICKKIIELSHETYSNGFYLKTQPYKDYFLNDYLTRDQYEDAISKEIIKPRGMSQYAIYKLLYEYDSSLQQQISKSKLNKLISSIRKNRNELAHGTFDNTKLKYNDVSRQIKSFTDLISIINA